jgi:hypothetical protein
MRLDVEFSYKWANNIGIVLVECQVINLSVMVLIQDQNSALLSFLLRRK